MESRIAIVQTPTQEFHKRNGFADKKCDLGDKPPSLQYCRKYTSSLPSDCKPWKIADMTLLSAGYFAILDSANLRLKIFTPDFVHITTKIVPDDSNSVASLHGNKIYVMDKTSVQYYLFNDGRVSLEDKFQLTGMHYDISSAGAVLCLTKLTTLVLKNDEFETLETINFKARMGYSPGAVMYDKDGNLLFYNCDSNSIDCWNKFQEEKWHVDEVHSCISIHSYQLGWIVVGFKEVIFGDMRGKICVRQIKEPEIEDYRCSVIDCERKKLFVADKSIIYEYELGVENLLNCNNHVE